ncbi:hypothetical protein WN943_000278 [Citrus x changshan-huyou]
MASNFEDGAIDFWYTASLASLSMPLFSYLLDPYLL